MSPYSGLLRVPPFSDGTGSHFHTWWMSLAPYPALGREGYRLRPDFHWRDERVRALLRLMGPSVIAGSTTQVNVLINSVFASELGDGRTFWLTVAFRLMQLPLGIFGVALRS